MDRVPPKNQRAQGRPGARCTRGLVCNVHSKKNAHEHTGSAETLRPSLRNGFTAYIVLSPVTGLFCHRRLWNRIPQTWHQHRGVRTTRLRRTLQLRSSARHRRARRCRVHRIPRRVSWRLRIRPSGEAGWRELV